MDRAANLVREVLRLRELDPDAQVSHLLEEAERLVDAGLSSEELRREVVRVAVALFQVQWDGVRIVEVLGRYLSRELEVDEELWARWQRIDWLAILGRCEEAVSDQLALLAWVEDRGLPERLAEVWHDSTQLGCWVALDRKNDWLTQFWRVIELCPAVPENRAERIELLFTGLSAVSDRDLGEQLLTRMTAVLAEDPDWEERQWAEDRLWKHRLLTAVREANTDELRKTADEYVEWIETQGWDAQTRAGYISDIGFTFLLAEQYADAIEFFDRAIENGLTRGHGYVWCAAAVWAAQKDRKRVVALLREASRRMPSHQAEEVFKATNQFQDSHDEADFLEALRG